MKKYIILISLFLAPALALGAEPGFSPDTVWFNPYMEDDPHLEERSPIRFDPHGQWWQVHEATLREQLTPDHEPFCKRLIFSPDYYQAIQRENAQLVRQDIERIEGAGIRTADGNLHALDIIVLATGFKPCVASICLYIIWRRCVVSRDGPATLDLLDFRAV